MLGAGRAGSVVGSQLNGLTGRVEYEYVAPVTTTLTLSIMFPESNVIACFGSVNVCPTSSNASAHPGSGPLIIRFGKVLVLASTLIVLGVEDVGVGLGVQPTKISAINMNVKYFIILFLLICRN